MRAPMIALAVAAALAAIAGSRAEEDKAAPSASHAEATVHLGHAWIRPPLGGRDVTAAYGRLHNPTDMDDRLLAAASPSASSVEIHTTEDDGDVMRMVKLDGVDVPAGERVVLAPGGMHFMLFGVAGPLTPGQSVPLTLTFERAGEVEAHLQVADAEPEEHDHHAGH
ncbi:MAG: copper chaperone PCu(A)C [Caulobacterales bacterium]|nr:copper chaperone PCu(A)C [Caulobacterales bacterium]